MGAKMQAALKSTKAKIMAKIEEKGGAVLLNVLARRVKKVTT